MENKEVNINLMCECRSEIMNITKTEDGDMFISIYEDMFLSKQEGLWRTFVHRIKNAFNMLRGKEYYLCNIIIRSEKREKVLGELIETLQKMK